MTTSVGAGRAMPHPQNSEHIGVDGCLQAAVDGQIQTPSIRARAIRTQEQQRRGDVSRAAGATHARSIAVDAAHRQARARNSPRIRAFSTWNRGSRRRRATPPVPEERLVRGAKGPKHQNLLRDAHDTPALDPERPEPSSPYRGSPERRPGSGRARGSCANRSRPSRPRQRRRRRCG